MTENQHVVQKELNKAGIKAEVRLTNGKRSLAYNIKRGHFFGLKKGTHYCPQNKILDLNYHENLNPKIQKVEKLSKEAIFEHDRYSYS